MPAVSGEEQPGSVQAQQSGRADAEQAAAAAAAEQQRSRCADFAFLRELGRGAWGTVYVARRQQDGQLYAVKAVELQGLSRRDQLAAVAEAQVLSSLDSPHIVKYYDSYLHGGQLHIVQELCGGGSLHAAIRRARRPLPEDAIWRVLLHTALALHHMHSRRMLHRDVKTMNIFLSTPLDQQGGQQQQRFKLGDVGVSKVLEEGRSHASTLIGTPYYLSPELAQELPYGPPSDMWALGVVLYECATLRQPFDGRSQASLIMKILRGRYEPVVGLSADLTAIIHRLLSQAAARRPSADTLLGLPAVRARAAELGIELPAGVGAAAAADGGVERRRTPPRTLQAQASLRRATCPGTPPPEEQAAAAAAPVAQRRVSRGSAALAEAAAAPPAAARPQPQALPERAPAVGERRKPPLPPSAVPLRRRTVQSDAARQGSPAAPPAAVPKAAPAHVQPAAEQPALAAAAPATQTAAGAGGSPACSGGAAAPASPPRRQSHFSVQQHLEQMSGAARQWLAAQQRGSAGGGGESSAEVQRSAKSDSSLLALRKPGGDGGGGGEGGAAGVAAGSNELAAESQAQQDRDGKQAALLRLRQRCVALLGSEALFQELHALARAAVDADGGSAGGTLAAFSGQLFERLGYSGHAAEALHLLLKMLYHEG